MNIEEKAKAYDNIIEKANKMHSENCEACQMCIEELIPELAESEDEKIRKWLIRLINTAGYRELESDKMPCSRTNVIAWLEKQGEITKEWSEMKINNIQTELQDMVDLKQKTERGEHKPADKVEPKFHEGDWTVSNLDKKARQISEVHFDEYNSYYVIDGESVNLEEYDRLHHLWTIQDAKNGDVLSYRDGQWIFIYKGIVTEDTFKYYALLSEKGITVNNAAFSLLTSCITPATKEQRDQLKKAMDDAGYTFDFEKKELKKIEQKTTVIIPKFRVDDKIKTVNEESLTITKIDEKGYWSEDLFICDFDEECLWDLVEQKPKWSEEDEIILSNIIDCIIKLPVFFESIEIDGEDKTSKEFISKATNWLKFLKDRYTWKPSDEQMKALKRCCDGWGDNGDGILDSLYEQLKKL